MQDLYTMQETGTESQPEEVRKDSTKIYFFVVAIAALLATNIYFYIKYKNTGDKVYELTDEKVSMQAEIDRIEVELDRLIDENAELSTSLKVVQDSVRNTIAALRAQLAQNNLTREQLANAQQEISHLKQQVSGYRSEVAHLRNQNAQLVTEREVLREEISTASDRVVVLEEQNTDLTDKVKVASALKVSSITINGVRERNNGKEDAEVRARRVDKFKITFTIADNALANKGMHDVYMRIIDPNGNLRTLDNNFFDVNGNQMQYTDRTAIDFVNDGATYSLEWRDAKGFQKGTYTMLLYADNAVMGQSSVVLK